MSTLLREPHLTQTGKHMGKRAILAQSGVDAMALCLSFSMSCTGDGVTQPLVGPLETTISPAKGRMFHRVLLSSEKMMMMIIIIILIILTITLRIKRRI